MYLVCKNGIPVSKPVTSFMAAQKLSSSLNTHTGKEEYAVMTELQVAEAKVPAKDDLTRKIYAHLSVIKSGTLDDILKAMKLTNSISGHVQVRLRALISEGYIQLTKDIYKVA